MSIPIGLSDGAVALSRDGRLGGRWVLGPIAALGEQPVLDRVIHVGISADTIRTAPEFDPAGALDSERESAMARHHAPAALPAAPERVRAAGLR